MPVARRKFDHLVAAFNYILIGLQSLVSLGHAIETLGAFLVAQLVRVLKAFQRVFITMTPQQIEPLVHLGLVAAVVALSLGYVQRVAC